MLPELGSVSAAAHGSVWVCEEWMSDRVVSGRRCRWRYARRRCSSLLMLLEMQQCFVVSSSARVEVVILFRPSVNAVIYRSSTRCTVGVLQMVLWLHTHHLWNAKTSGVVRNVGIIMDGTEGWPRGLLLHMASLASLLVEVEAGGWEEAGRGLFRHS